MATRAVGHVSGDFKRHAERAGIDPARVSRGSISSSGGRLTAAVPIPPAGEAAPPAAGDLPAGFSATGYSAADFGTFSDLELWQLFQNSSDERAFAELYQRHKAEIYTYCLRMMSGDRDRANDVFQEVFIRAFEKAGQFRMGANVAGWLFMIARNLCLN